MNNDDKGLPLSPSLMDIESNIKRMECFYFHKLRFYLFNTCTFFLFFPFYKWFLCFRMLFFSRCELDEGTHILVTTKDDSWKFALIIRYYSTDNTKFLFWEFQYLRYYFNKTHIEELNFDYHKTFTELKNYQFTSKQHQWIKLIHGENILKVSFHFLQKMLIKELINPFYIFQIIIIAYWFYDGYILYSWIIIILTIISIVESVIDLFKLIVSLRKINNSVAPIEVKFSDADDYSLLLNSDIVPGIRCRILNPMCVNFDCILLKGKCHVQEAAVTGNTLIKLKTEVPFLRDGKTVYNILHHHQHTIYAGSVIEEIETSCEVLVINTGFYTLYGRLIRNMLYPINVKYLQYKDALWYVPFLGLICIIGFSICIPTFVKDKLTLWEILGILFDFITLSIPPILPAAMSVGSSMAIRRLKESEIYCVSPAKIVIAGKVSMICVDLQGTLIEEAQTFIGYHLIDEGTKLGEFKKVREIETYKSNANKTKAEFLYGLATCHMLTLHKGEVIGLKQEKEVFVRTKAKLIDLKDNHLEIDIQGVKAQIIRRQHNKVKSLLSVLVHYEGEEYRIYAKGNLNDLEEISKTNDIFKDYKEVIENYESKCHRVIGLCSKQVTIEDIDQDWNLLLKDMDLLGVLVLKLSIHENAVHMIEELKHSAIPCILFSEETPETSIAIAKKLKLIEPQEQLLINKSSRDLEANYSLQYTKSNDMQDIELYIDRNKNLAGNKLISNRLETRMTTLCDKEATKTLLTQMSFTSSLKFIKQAKVFSNLKGDSTQLIATLANCKESVMMVGSPYTEYGALSKSDVGILLSTTHQHCVFASLTCPKNYLMGIPLIIAEGRAALITSYECFKWMAISSIIQFSSIAILRCYSLTMTNEQFLYVDLILILPLAYTMSWSRPRKKLTPKQPSSSLLSSSVLVSVIGQIIIQVLAQILMFFILTNESSSCFAKGLNSNSPQCLEVTGIFHFTNIQYLATVLTYTRGDPFREAIYRNEWFAINVVLGIVISYCLILLDSNYLKWFGVAHMENIVKMKIMIGSIVNFAITYFFELTIKGFVKLCWNKN